MISPTGHRCLLHLYILTNAPEERLRAALQCDAFIRYVAALRKYKSGGYYTFNARELQQYLNHALRGA